MTSLPLFALVSLDSLEGNFFGGRSLFCIFDAGGEVVPIPLLYLVLSMMMPPLDNVPIVDTVDTARAPRSSHAPASCKAQAAIGTLLGVALPLAWLAAVDRYIGRLCRRRYLRRTAELSSCHDPQEPVSLLPSSSEPLTLALVIL